MAKFKTVEIKVQIVRDEKPVTVDLFELHDIELEAFYADFSLAKANSWLFTLTQQIKMERYARAPVDGLGVQIERNLKEIAETAARMGVAVEKFAEATRLLAQGVNEAEESMKDRRD